MHVFIGKSSLFIFIFSCSSHQVSAAEIAMIKVAGPNMAWNVIDRAIQSFGGMGLCQDTPLPSLLAWARILKLADGPDEVHLRSIARIEFQRHNQAKL